LGFRRSCLDLEALGLRKAVESLANGQRLSTLDLFMEDESELLALRRARLDTWRQQGVDPFGGAFPGTEGCRQVVESLSRHRKL